MATGVDLAKIELSKIGYKYVWGAIGPNTFDCSGLNYWAMGVLGIPGAHAHRTAEALLEWCRATGRLRSVGECRGIVGAWAFMTNSSGQAHHVVTSLGNGSTIEASNPRTGVGVFNYDRRGFSHAGLCPSLNFSSNIPTAPVPTPSAPPPPVPSLQGVINLCRLHAAQRPFQEGDGPRNNLEAGVKLIQHALLYSGISWAPGKVPEIDGEYGAITADCVKWYQHVHGLTPWGAVDLPTFNVMYK